jgi:hypothetical protein
MTHSRSARKLLSCTGILQGRFLRNDTEIHLAFQKLQPLPKCEPKQQKVSHPSCNLHSSSSLAAGEVGYRQEMRELFESALKTPFGFLQSRRLGGWSQGGRKDNCFLLWTNIFCQKFVYPNMFLWRLQGKRKERVCCKQSFISVQFQHQSE